MHVVDLINSIIVHRRPTRFQTPSVSLLLMFNSKLILPLCNSAVLKCKITQSHVNIFHTDFHTVCMAVYIDLCGGFPKALQECAFIRHRSLVSSL